MVEGARVTRSQGGLGDAQASPCQHGCLGCCTVGRGLRDVGYCVVEVSFKYQNAGGGLRMFVWEQAAVGYLL